MSQLPMNWTLGQLSQAAHIVRGITFPAGEKRSDFALGYVCCLRTTNVQQTLEWNDVYYVPTSYVKRDDQIVREGDVLMSMANSYELVGKVARAGSVPQRAAFGAFLAAVRPTLAIDGGYLYHFLRSSEAQSKLREGSSQTTNIANISAGRLSELPVPLAPLDEQKRIAKKLDTVITRVGAVNERLARVAPLLKRFRQSVLAAATSGRLTCDINAGVWPISTDLGAHCEVLGGKRLPKGFQIEEEDTGFPYIRVTDFNNFGVKVDQVKYVPKDAAQAISRYIIKGADVYISIAGSIGLVGRVPARFDGANLTENAARIVVNSEIHPSFLMYQLGSPQLQDQMHEKKIATTQDKLGLFRVKTLQVCIPSFDEQTEIVRRVETLFAFADRLEARLQTAQTATDRLTPSLLAKAFRGELVSQDPNDEPASELLKRLVATTVQSTALKRGRKSSA